MRKFKRAILCGVFKDKSGRVNKYYVKIYKREQNECTSSPVWRCGGEQAWNVTQTSTGLESVTHKSTLFFSR